MIVFDTEATDLAPGQICQLSYLIVEDGRVTGKNMFFAVDEMSESAQEVHGMSMEDLEKLSGGERFEDRAEEIFEDFSAAKLLIGHNVSADDRYIRVEFERLNMKLGKIKTFCTMNYFTCVMNLKRKINTGRPKPRSLRSWSSSTASRLNTSRRRQGNGSAAADRRMTRDMTLRRPICV